MQSSNTGIFEQFCDISHAIFMQKLAILPLLVSAFYKSVAKRCSHTTHNTKHNHKHKHNQDKPPLPYTGVWSVWLPEILLPIMAISEDNLPHSFPEKIPGEVLTMAQARIERSDGANVIPPSWWHTGLCGLSFQQGCSCGCRHFTSSWLFLLQIIISSTLGAYKLVHLLSMVTGGTMSMRTELKEVDDHWLALLFCEVYELIMRGDDMLSWGGWKTTNTTGQKGGKRWQ